ADLGLDGVLAHPHHLGEVAARDAVDGELEDVDLAGRQPALVRDLRDGRGDPILGGRRLAGQRALHELLQVVAELGLADVLGARGRLRRPEAAASAWWPPPPCPAWSHKWRGESPPLFGDPGRRGYSPVTRTRR